MTYVDHDDFLALGVPGPRAEDALGVRWRLGEVEEALEVSSVAAFQWNLIQCIQLTQ
jgi:hypothetical protein